MPLTLQWSEKLLLTVPCLDSPVLMEYHLYNKLSSFFCLFFFFKGSLERKWTAAPNILGLEWEIMDFLFVEVSIDRRLLVNEKCVFFSDAMLSLHAYLFPSPSLPSSHTDPPMNLVLLCHLLLRDCRGFLPVYWFLTALSQILFFRILTGFSKLSCTLEVLCSSVT